MSQYYFSHTKPHADVEIAAIKTGCMTDCKYRHIEIIKTHKKCGVCGCKYKVTQSYINCQKESEYDNRKKAIIQEATIELNKLFNKNWKHANYLYKKTLSEKFYDLLCPFYERNNEKKLSTLPKM